VTTTIKKGPAQRKRSIEEQVAFALGHRTRVLILLVLNEGEYSPSEIAEIIDEPLNKVYNHLHELVEGGSIEVAYTRQRRSMTQHFYRATQVVHFTKENVEDMTEYETQVTAGIVLQSLVAETLASWRAKKMNDDPDVCLVWDRFKLDEAGWKAVAKEQDQQWARLTNLAQAEAARASDAGAKTTSYFAASLGFERALTPPKPRKSGIGE
jgi:DNA-binding transcriptional ArsR family regulator